ncbi:MAG TPA: hypothetical protein H9902_04270 [Candidatus Stackebrandtia faecavium]|nr:hypothetical protein [Candidatus Stackebrandtia faecavium]
METTTTSTLQASQSHTDAIGMSTPNGSMAGRIVSDAVSSAGLYAQRAGATWLLWLRATSDTPPHEDL